jgi:hypothetical protein
MAEVTQQPSGQIRGFRNQYRKEARSDPLFFEARHPSIFFVYMGWMDSEKRYFFYILTNESSGTYGTEVLGEISSRAS